MKGIRAKKIAKILIFAVIAVLIFNVVNDILIVKRADGITNMKSFYAQDKDTVDVLFIGNSHAGMNFDAGTLWEDYGIASFSLWGSVQPFWNTYYFLQEAMKTQHPKVVCLEISACCFFMEYLDEARQVTNVDGMHYNLNRWKAATISAPREWWLNLFLGFPMYHERYSEITADDFNYFPFNSHLIVEKGTGWRIGVYDGDLPDISQSVGTKPLDEKEEKYLRLIIEYCKENDIPLLLVGTPNSEQRDASQYYFNMVGEIAKEYSVDYIDYNLLDDETGITPLDYWTDGNHMNTEGARKLSRHLGKILVEKYNIPDRRGDEAYSSWDEFALEVNEGYAQMIADAMMAAE